MRTLFHVKSLIAEDPETDIRVEFDHFLSPALSFFPRRKKEGGCSECVGKGAGGGDHRREGDRVLGFFNGTCGERIDDLEKWIAACRKGAIA